MGVLARVRLDDHGRRSDLSSASTKNIGSKSDQLLKERKLMLVLDLDETLINTTAAADLIPEEQKFLEQADARIKDDVFKLHDGARLTKLRPFLRTFLKEAQKMFEMYIYTMGNKRYARAVAQILDPERKHFTSKSRVISRSDFSTRDKKGLDLVTGDDRMVIILDDSEHIWKEPNRENLIVAERYNFFSKHMRGEGKSYSERNEDESESDGFLANILNVLKRAHGMFFDQDQEGDRDAREVLRSVRKDILKGCKIVFSGSVDPNNYFWKMAEKMGATCCSELDISVTCGGCV